jgi:hypothetical protein
METMAELLFDLWIEKKHRGEPGRAALELDATEELCELDLQRSRDLLDIDERNVPFSALDGPEVRAVETAPLRELLLGKPHRLASPSDRTPKSEPHIFHARL